MERDANERGKADPPGHPNRPSGTGQGLTTGHCDPEAPLSYGVSKKSKDLALNKTRRSDASSHSSTPSLIKVVHSMKKELIDRGN